MTGDDVFRSSRPEDHRYGVPAPSLAQDVPPPSYSMILDWMRASTARSVSFDIWARGNYVRHIVGNHRGDAPPLIVPFTRVDELRWAHRRLALLGVPILFVYMRGVTPPKKILHLYPADGVVNEGGWGYVGALGSIVKIRRKRWFPVIGYSRLMPESLFDWLVDEAAEDFQRGDVFIAPAELIGLDPSAPDRGVQALEAVVGGRRAHEAAQASASLMQLQFPYLDGMSPKTFRRLLRDHEDELVRFRSAFKRLVAGVPEGDLPTLIEQLREEVAALSQSNRQASLRRTAVRLGGSLATVGAAVAAAATVGPELVLPVAASAGAVAATNTLTELWKQRAEAAGQLRESPYFLAFKLGMDKPSKVQAGPPRIDLRTVQTAVDPGKLSDFHWLCPPTPGLRFAAAKR